MVSGSFSSANLARRSTATVVAARCRTEIALGATHHRRVSILAVYSALLQRLVVHAICTNRALLALCFPMVLVVGVVRVKIVVQLEQSMPLVVPLQPIVHALQMVIAIHAWMISTALPTTNVSGVTINA